MALILFDTNIFIDMLGGYHQAAVELNAYDEPAISVITLMELRAGQAARPTDKIKLAPFLETFIVLPMDEDVMEMAIEIRGNSLITPPKIKLPDAIIAATADVWGVPVVTRNPRDFHMIKSSVHVPYDLDTKTRVVSNIRTFDMSGKRTVIRIK